MFKIKESLLSKITQLVNNSKAELSPVGVVASCVGCMGSCGHSCVGSCSGSCHGYSR